MKRTDLIGEMEARNARIAVLGLGHVGLPTALSFVEQGWPVCGADQDSAKVQMLQSGKPPFYEAGLEELLIKSLGTGRLTFSQDIENAIRSASILFICVGTPQRESGEPDLTEVERVARTIARNLGEYKLIIEKSTVPATTAQRIKRTIARYVGGSPEGVRRNGNRPEALFDVASNPEFLQEGKALEGCLRPERIVCGVESPLARQLIGEMYRSFHCPKLITDLNTAELIKHSANAFLAMKISFINLMADFCETVGADVTQVAEGMGLDARIGLSFLSAGLGFGGYCLPKDLRALIHAGTEQGVDCGLLREVERINERRVPILVRKLRSKLWVLKGKNIGLWGLAFKPGTDDVRNAPSLKLIEALLGEGARLQLHDPRAIPEVERLFPAAPGVVTYCKSMYEAAQNAHAVILVTEWNDYRRPDWNLLRELMQVPIIIDGRNLYDPAELESAGLEYAGVGKSYDASNELRPTLLPA